MFAHVLAKTIIDETGDGNSRVPVKSTEGITGTRQTQACQLLALA